MLPIDEISEFFKNDMIKYQISHQSQRNFEKCQLCLDKAATKYCSSCEYKEESKLCDDCMNYNHSKAKTKNHEILSIGQAPFDKNKELYLFDFVKKEASNYVIVVYVKIVRELFMIIIILLK